MVWQVNLQFVILLTIIPSNHMISPELGAQKLLKAVDTLRFNQAVSFLDSSLADVGLLSSRQITEEGKMAITILHEPHGRGVRTDRPFTVVFDVPGDPENTKLHLEEGVVLSLKREQLIQVIAYMRTWGRIIHQSGHGGREWSRLNLKKMYEDEIDHAVEFVQNRDHQLHKPSLN